LIQLNRGRDTPPQSEAEIDVGRQGAAIRTAQVDALKAAT